MSIRLAAVVAISCWFCSGATAQVTTFTSFDPGDGYDTTQGLVVRGPLALNPQRVASQFTSSETGALHSIRFANWYQGNGSTELQVRLYDDNANTIGNQLIEWSIANTNAVPDIDLVVNPGNSPVLQTGQLYWLELFAVLDGDHVWNRTSPGHTTRLALSTNDGASYSYFNNVLGTAYEVNLVPEPSAVAALALGLIGLALPRAHRRAVQ